MGFGLFLYLLWGSRKPQIPKQLSSYHWPPKPALLHAKGPLAQDAKVVQKVHAKHLGLSFPLSLGFRVWGSGFIGFKVFRLRGLGFSGEGVYGLGFADVAFKLKVLRQS